MDVEDDNTYAVIVSESGETQVFRLGCVDDSSSSLANQLVVLLDANVGADPADVTSKESNDKAEGPPIEDRGTEAEIRSPYKSSRKRKKSIARESAVAAAGTVTPYELRIPGDHELQRNLSFAKKLRKLEYRGERRVVIPSDENYQVKTVPESPRDDYSYSSSMIGTGAKFFWTRAMTRALVDEYRSLTVEFRNPEKRQRDVWESLAKELRRKGYAGITWDMCDRKWRNLKSTFKTIYHSNRELYSKRRWEFYEEFKILFAPDVRGTRTERKSRTIQPRPESDREENNTFQATEDLGENPDPEGRSKQPWWFREFFDLYRTGYTKELDLASERHRNRTKINDRTCELLERLIDSV